MTSAEYLQILDTLMSGSTGAKCALSRKPYPLPPEVIEALAQDEHPHVRYWLANSKQPLTPETPYSTMKTKILAE